MRRLLKVALLMTVDQVVQNVYFWSDVRYALYHTFDPDPDVAWAEAYDQLGLGPRGFRKL